MDQALKDLSITYRDANETIWTVTLAEIVNEIGFEYSIPNNVINLNFNSEKIQVLEIKMKEQTIYQSHL